MEEKSFRFYFLAANPNPNPNPSRFNQLLQTQIHLLNRKFDFLRVDYVLLHANLLSINGLFLFGLFVFVQVYSATELMSRNKNAKWYSLIASVICLGICFYDPTFFSVNGIAEIVPYLLMVYFVCQAIVAFAFGESLTASKSGMDVQVV